MLGTRFYFEVGDGFKGYRVFEMWLKRAKTA